MGIDTVDMRANNLPHWMQASRAQHKRKQAIRNVKRLLRLVVIGAFVGLVYAFCTAVHFTPWLTAVLCALTAAGVYADLTG